MSDFLRPHGLLHGILQARILEWVAFPFSRGSSQPRDRTQVSCIADGFFWGSPAPGIVEPNRKKRSTSSFLAKWVWKSFIRVRLFVIPWTSPWNSPGQNTGVGRLSLLQGIFPTQGLNAGLHHCRQILYQLSYQGSPRHTQMFSATQNSFCRWFIQTRI